MVKGTAGRLDRRTGRWRVRGLDRRNRWMVKGTAGRLDRRTDIWTVRGLDRWPVRGSNRLIVQGRACL